MPRMRLACFIGLVLSANRVLANDEDHDILLDALFNNTAEGKLAVFMLSSSCEIADIKPMVPFFDYIFSGLRVESLASTIGSLLVLFSFIQLGGIPDPRDETNHFSVLGTIMWSLWLYCMISQWFFTLLSLLTLVLAACSTVQQFSYCLVRLPDDQVEVAWTGAAMAAWSGGILTCTFCATGLRMLWMDPDGPHDRAKMWEFASYGGRYEYDDLSPDKRAYLRRSWYICVAGVAILVLSPLFGAAYGAATAGFTLFGTIIPALLVHPAFVSKSAALIAYVFTIGEGFHAAGLDVDPNRFLLNYQQIMIIPFAIVGLLHWITSGSFGMSTVFFAPISVTIALAFMAMIWFINQCRYWTKRTMHKIHPAVGQEVTLTCLLFLFICLINPGPRIWYVFL